MFTRIHPKNVHEMSSKKCPRKVTQKEDISWTFLSTKCRQKCPRDVTPFVHEMSPIMSTKCLPPVLSNNEWVSRHLPDRDESEPDLYYAHLEPSLLSRPQATLPALNLIIAVSYQTLSSRKDSFPLEFTHGIPVSWKTFTALKMSEEELKGERLIWS